MNKKLAKIRKANLEIKERGILTFSILVDYEQGGSQVIGNLVLDKWDESKKIRIGTAYGCEMIRRLLFTLDVDDFSEMSCKMIWVYGEGDYLNFEPKGIQTLKVDGIQKDPLIFEDVFKLVDSNHEK